MKPERCIKISNQKMVAELVIDIDDLFKFLPAKIDEWNHSIYGAVGYVYFNLLYHRSTANDTVFPQGEQYRRLLEWPLTNYILWDIQVAMFLAG